MALEVVIMTTCVIASDNRFGIMPTVGFLSGHFSSENTCNIISSYRNIDDNMANLVVSITIKYIGRILAKLIVHTCAVLGVWMLSVFLLLHI